MRSTLLLVACVAWAMVAVAAESAVFRQGERVAAAGAPLVGAKCGAGLRGFCTAKAAWCPPAKGTPQKGICAGTALCCYKGVATAPVAAPAAPAAPARAPGSTIGGRVVITADASANSPQSSELVGDLSPEEEERETATAETPLSASEAAKVQVEDAKVRVVPGSNGTPRIEFDPRVLRQDTTVVAGRLVPMVQGNKASLPATGAVTAANGLCGAYANKPATTIAGNRGVNYSVVKILPQHLQSPSLAGFSPSQRDNTMRTITACAFDRMYTAAKAQGVTILIASGFRTLARQQYFYNCMKTSKCNINPKTKRGRLAATPGSSNHGIGLALDLNQGAPGVYAWLAKNGQKYGFVRTVPTERWHWEYRPGTPKAKYT